MYIWHIKTSNYLIRGKCIDLNITHPCGINTNKQQNKNPYCSLLKNIITAKLNVDQ